MILCPFYALSGQGQSQHWRISTVAEAWPHWWAFNPWSLRIRDGIPDPLPAILLTFWNSADSHARSAVTKEDIQSHFKDGPGNITEVKLMNGFGFIEYDNALDARDVVPGMQALHASLC